MEHKFGKKGGAGGVRTSWDLLAHVVGERDEEAAAG